MLQQKALPAFVRGYGGNVNKLAVYIVVIAENNLSNFGMALKVTRYGLYLTGSARRPDNSAASNAVKLTQGTYDKDPEHLPSIIIVNLCWICFVTTALIASASHCLQPSKAQ